MDFNDIGDILPVILVIIALIVVQFFFRRRDTTPSSQQHIVQALLSDIRINLRLVEVLMEGEQIKRFSVNNWKANMDKLDFLQPNLQSTLNEVFDIAQDYNEQVAATRNYQSVNYVASIDTVKMDDRLRKCRSSLEDWLMKNVGTTDPGGKTGMFDSLFGRR